MSTPLTSSGLSPIVRGVAGVTDAYSPRPALAQVADMATAALRGAVVPPPEVVVEAAGDLVSVSTRIAVDRAASAADVARGVADALLDQLPDGATVSVDVGRIS
ncbi:hypothetical protein FBY40_0995 [Microbacterium sp. SLBN-154]|uniref:hypothetical protein n=1 Tax=Microbacterium sp. SLBN-154 TaxID=2768458 RepID=UPI0011526C34|nr:hypothetical protein [Microbacterium sp. SLBN-154]TQK18508.1 hypothetical protein FBY40_0995 [Microbacterium sp. SLBN-154]